jgi:hypothetical protein
MNKIAKNIETSVLEFTRLIAEKYDLQQDILMDMWTDVTKMKTKASKAKKPQSAYQIFSAEQRKLIKEMEPNMTFGDVAKEIGTRWRELSSKEKAAYAPTTAAKTSDLQGLSKQQLLEMCSAKGIKIAKNKSKDEIIAAIQEAVSDNGSVAASSVKSHASLVISVKSHASLVISDNGSVAASSVKSHTSDLQGLSKQQLLEMCSAKGIKIAKNKSKDEIIAAIQENGSVAASSVTLEEEDEEQDMLAVYKSMKTQDLADICKNKGLSSKGTREVLIRRLLTAIA